MTQYRAPQQAKPPEPQPPKRKLRQYERRSRLKRSDLSPLENPLKPEERTPELMVIYRRAADTVEPAELDRLCAEVEKLLSKEEKNGGGPRCIYQRLRISFEQLAQELGFSTQEALGLLKERPTARKEPLSGDCMIEGQEILDLQSALVQAKLESLPELPAAGKGSHPVTPVVAAAEGDAPSQLMDFDALSALYRDWAGQRKALKERHNAAAEPYQRALSDPNPPKIYPRWVNKYTAMDKLLRQRKEEIRSSQKAKSEYWQKRILDRWKASHPLPSKEERGSLRALPSSGKLAFGLRVITLFLLQLFFSCCNILRLDWGGSLRVGGYFIAQLQSLPDMPNALTEYLEDHAWLIHPWDVYPEKFYTFSRGFFFVAAVVCCVLYHRCCGTSMRRMRSWLPAAFAIFFLTNTLLYPLLPAGVLAHFLLAPAAILIHIAIASPRRSNSRRAGSPFPLDLPISKVPLRLYTPLTAAAKLITFVLFWGVQLYIALRIAYGILYGSYVDDNTLQFIAGDFAFLRSYIQPTVTTLLVFAAMILLVPPLRKLFREGPFRHEDYLERTECMLAAYAIVQLAGQLAGRIPVVGGYFDLPLFGIAELWRWAAALVLARFFYQRFVHKTSPVHVPNTLLLSTFCVIQVGVVYFVVTDLFHRGYRFFSLGPFDATLPVVAGLIVICARGLRAPFGKRIDCRAHGIALLYLLFLVFWLATMGPASAWLAGVLPPTLPECAHMAPAVYFTGLHMILLLLCYSPIFG